MIINCFSLHTRHWAFRDSSERQYKNLKFYQTPPKEKYLIYGRINSWNFFNWIKNLYMISENFLDEELMQDLHDGKCKLVLEDIEEGQAGEIEWKYLEFFLKALKYPKNCTYLLHGNFRYPKVNKFFEYNPVSYFHSNWPQIHEITKYNPINTQNLFLCYNRLARFHRIILVAELIKEGLFEKGIISFRKIETKNLIEKFTYHERLDLIDSVDKLEKLTPLELEYDLMKENPVYKLTNEHHEHTFLSLVTETITQLEVKGKFESSPINTPIFFSEKTWKPISIGQPFIILASKGHLDFLKKLGYKTFSNWWSEEYDNIDDVHIKIKLIIEELQRLSKLSVGSLKDMRLEMNEVLKHNQMIYNNFRDSVYNSNNESLYKKIQIIWNSF